MQVLHCVKMTYEFKRFTLRRTTAIVRRLFTAPTASRPAASWSKAKTHCPTAAWDMQAFWYNVTKACEVKYGPTVVGNVVQITRNGNSAA